MSTFTKSGVFLVWQVASKIRRKGQLRKDGMVGTPTLQTRASQRLNMDQGTWTGRCNYCLSNLPGIPHSRSFSIPPWIGPPVYRCMEQVHPLGVMSIIKTSDPEKGYANMKTS